MPEAERWTFLFLLLAVAQEYRHAHLIMAIYGIHTMARYVVINNAMREEGGRHAAVEAEGHLIDLMEAVAGRSFTSERNRVERKSFHFFLSG